MKISTFYSLLIGILVILLSACNSGSSNSTSSASSSFIINKVSILKTESDTQASEFSIKIELSNTGTNAINYWKFGFYMPRSYNQLVSDTQNINPNLVMNICESGTNTCANLSYQIESNITESDLSAGYLTVLAPTTNFPLISGKNYIINLLQNNQWKPSNYSAAPQSFFIISGSTVLNATPESSNYDFVDYDSSVVETSINTKITQDWDNSNNESISLNIIPTPVSYEPGSGMFSLNSEVAIHNLMPGNDNTVARFMQDDLAKDINVIASIDNTSSSTGIIINEISNQSVIESNPEGYQIIVTDSAITINALNNTGVFYALQTLRQLWNQSSTINAGIIIDYPRFKYRGLLLDTARHFFTVSEVESVIDLATTHKLNTLHVHFADDEGFRLGLINYPTILNLADSRGYGIYSMIGLYLLQANLDVTNINDLIYPSVNTSYTGTYSPTDIAKLIDYANKRSMTIIPEVDLPGHARALIKALPSAFVDPNDTSRYISVQGYSDDVIPVCTYNTSISVGESFTTNMNYIVNNIAQLFNQQTTLYKVTNEVSVGGDEVSSGAWTSDTSCQGDWENLDALAKSQKFFAMLSSNNESLKLSGWQQYVQTDTESLGSDVVPASNSGHVWIWNVTGAVGYNQAKTLAESSYPVVLDFADQNYFDLTYTPAITEPGFSWATQFSDTYASLSSAISATTVIESISSEYQQNILGVEGALWGENMASYDHLIYMASPKMAGLSEASWSSVAVTNNSNKPDWHSLAERLGCGTTGFLAYLNKLYQIHYRGYPNGINLEVPSGTVCN